MSCAVCNPQKGFKTFTMPCRVCEIVDKDSSIKWVDYCSLCKAYICEPCWNNPIRRAKAALLNYLLPLF